MVETAMTFLWVALLAILAVKHTPWAVLSVLGALPIFLVRFSLLGIPTTPLELGIYTVALVWGGKKFIARRIRRGGTNEAILLEKSFRAKRKNLEIASVALGDLAMTLKRPLAIPLILWLGMTVASSVYAPDNLVGLGILKAWFVDPLLLTILILDLHRRKLLTLTHIVWALGAGASVVALYGILDLLTLIGSIKIKGRLDSFYESANYVSLYIGPILMMWLAMLIGEWRERTWKMRVLYAAGAGVMILTLLLTKSFGGWIATAAGMGLLLVLAPRGKKARIVGVLGIIILALALGWYGMTKGFQHYNTLFKISSLDTRQDLWRGARGLIEEKPIFGHGIGGFRTNFPPYVRSHKELFPHYVDFYNALWPHNVYLAIWVESGIIALFGFLWLTAELLVRGLRVFRSRHDWTTLAGILALSAIAVHGLVDTPYFKNDLSVLFWMAVVFLITRAEQNARSSDSLESRSAGQKGVQNISPVHRRSQMSEEGS